MTRTIPALGAALITTVLLGTALIGAGRHVTAPAAAKAACLDAPAPAPEPEPEPTPVENQASCGAELVAQTEAR